MRDTKRREGGRARVGVLLFLLVVSAALLLADKLIPPYWVYLSLLDPVKEAALLAAATQGDEARARMQLVTAARAQGVELDEDDIEITQGAPGLIVRISWVTPVRLLRYHYNLHFSIEQTAHHP